MPISATGNKREQGFTLLELLVVMAIIGVMSAVVILAIPDPRGRLVNEAEKFAARSVAARDSAIISARATRVAVDARGYRFEQQSRGSWKPIAERPLTPTRWEDGTTSSSATVAFDPTGLAAPAIQITLQRGEERVLVAVGADGGVHVGG